MNMSMSLTFEEPTTIMWNGRAVSLPDSYELLPDDKVQFMHEEVMAVALHERRSIPFVGRVVGQARTVKRSIWLVEDASGRLVKTKKPLMMRKN